MRCPLKSQGAAAAVRSLICHSHSPLCTKCTTLCTTVCTKPPLRVSSVPRVPSVPLGEPLSTKCTKCTTVYHCVPNFHCTRLYLSLYLHLCVCVSSWLQLSSAKHTAVLGGGDVAILSPVILYPMTLCVSLYLHLCLYLCLCMSSWLQLTSAKHQC